MKIVDPEVGVDEQVHIKMNDPLRYRGDTFYQSGYSKLPDGEATTLQVVLNRGWMIPYVACMVVVIGMVAHFLGTVNAVYQPSRSRGAGHRRRNPRGV